MIFILFFSIFQKRTVNRGFVKKIKYFLFIYPDWIGIIKKFHGIQYKQHGFKL